MLWLWNVSNIVINRFFLICVCCWLGLASCFCWAKPLVLTVSILPQKYLVDRIVGDLGHQVQVMVPRGHNPAVYEPRPGQLLALAKSKAYLAIGVPFEQVWLERFAAMCKGLSIIHCEQGICKKDITSSSFLQANLLQTKACYKKIQARQGKDPHVWLSPPLFRVVAANTLNALLMLDPEHGKEYRRNFYDLSREIARVDAEISTLFLDKGVKRIFLTFHPAWGYFAQAYGLQQMALEVRGREPGPKTLQKVVRQARLLGIKTILTEPEFSQKSARLLAAELEGQVVAISPLSYDWSRNMLFLAHTLAGHP